MIRLSSNTKTNQTLLSSVPFSMKTKYAFLFFFFLLTGLLSFLSFFLYAFSRKKNAFRTILRESYETLSQTEKDMVLLKEKYEKIASEKAENVDRLKNREGKSSELLRVLSRATNRYYGLVNPIKMKNTFSQMITSDQIQLLEEWTGKKFMFSCYNSYIHGSLSGKRFHELCDSYRNTLTLILTSDDYILGGFTKEKWDGNGDKYDDHAFIFNLKNKQRFDIKRGKPAIEAREESLPMFGSDLNLSKDVFFSQFPSSYSSKDQDGIEGELYIKSKTMLEPILVEVFVLN